ncbi:efflux RND transporter periplasmic adaptor subunit [Sphingobacterium psychroaquaticum]|uniref:RND family efflux transporter, MFP subunit n=1 Tax=Sphingobacterium psychroaquaticum TaxID=561061 RepID=A0A1X7I2R8_9SPHI|nr:efflux RND transporter periplasmic adaptor subunit [Sphingobacterium psychroaquaticum]QBQ42013.1 efflux RND transporter periplasmic adaptor subunit [Sphingobacterium psychroaquaticum]SMG08095.1 RND family efflux transporter, MFP subunit [Sphingobacterium psychroaquaticum]
MLFSIYKIRLGLAVVLVTYSLTACNRSTKEAPADTKTEVEADDHDHEGAEATTVATLTTEQIKAAGIALGEISQKNLTAAIRANGVLRIPNNNRANATSLYGGVIKTLPIETGTYVRKGQVIATIVNPQFIQLQEDFLTTNSEIVLAEQELRRQQELNEGSAGTKRNLQTATAQLATLRTKQASLRQQIQLMGLNPAAVSTTSLRSSLVVTSPISGIVNNIFAKIGSYVDVSSPIVEIVDNDMIHLDLHVFERDLPKIKIGQTINFTITNNPTQTYTAKVSRIGASFENESKTIAVHSVVVGTKSGLIDGMNTMGTISLNDVKGSALPNEAVVEAGGKYYIFVQTNKEPENEHEGHDHGTEEKEAHNHAAEAKGNTVNFEKIEVLKGVSDLGFTAITPVSDLPPNTKVVVKGAFFIHAKMAGTVGHSH